MKTYRFCLMHDSDLLDCTEISFRASCDHEAKSKANYWREVFGGSQVLEMK